MNLDTLTLDEQKAILKALLRKGDAISRANISGGTLNPQQSDKFLDLTFDQSVLLKIVRNERRNTPSGEINKMYIGQPITRGADIFTGTKYTQTFGNALVTDKVPYETKKLLSFYIVPTEILEENIEREGFQQTLAEAAAKQLATDLEELAIYGDTTLPPPGSGATEADWAHYYLRVSNDGFLKQITAANGAHYYDAQGAVFDKRLASIAWRMVPDKYKNVGKAAYRFLCSPNVEQDWRDQLADRGTALGDSNISGLAPAKPFGIEMVSIPLWPENLGPNQDKTKVILTIPQNLIVVTSRNIKVFKMYDPERDSWVSITFMRMDFIVENMDAIVVIDNITPGAVA